MLRQTRAVDRDLFGTQGYDWRAEAVMDLMRSDILPKLIINLIGGIRVFC
jgi:hypothetical protein